jgi:hypothetical protein
LQTAQVSMVYTGNRKSNSHVCAQPGLFLKSMEDNQKLLARHAGSMTFGGIDCQNNQG